MNQRHESETRISEFDKFREIVARLRGRDGCPWDRAQTMESLKPCMINEMTEAVAGIDLYKATGNPENLCEELGDVLLQVVLLSQIAEEEGLFTIENEASPCIRQRFILAGGSPGTVGRDQAGGEGREAYRLGKTGKTGFFQGGAPGN